MTLHTFLSRCMLGIASLTALGLLVATETEAHPSAPSSSIAATDPPSKVLEIRFRNRAGADPSKVMILPYSLADAFKGNFDGAVNLYQPNAGGRLYSDPTCSTLIWQDGFPGKNTVNTGGGGNFAGCGSLPLVTYMGPDYNTLQAITVVAGQDTYHLPNFPVPNNAVDLNNGSTVKVDGTLLPRTSYHIDGTLGTLKFLTTIPHAGSSFTVTASTFGEAFQNLFNTTYHTQGNAAAGTAYWQTCLSSTGAVNWATTSFSCPAPVLVPNETYYYLPTTNTPSCTHCNYPSCPTPAPNTLTCPYSPGLCNYIPDPNHPLQPGTYNTAPNGQYGGSGPPYNNNGIEQEYRFLPSSGDICGCANVSIPVRSTLKILAESTYAAGNQYIGVVYRTLRLSDLQPGTDAEGPYYSVYTNYFPNGTIYIGVPSRHPDGNWSYPEDVPFCAAIGYSGYYKNGNNLHLEGTGPDAREVNSLTLALNGVNYRPVGGNPQNQQGNNLNYLIRPLDSHNNPTNAVMFYTPAGPPTPGQGPSPWNHQRVDACNSIAPNSSPTQGGGPGRQCENTDYVGCDWQQIEFGFDGSAADTADVTYINQVGIPIRLTSFANGSATGTGGFRQVSNPTFHPDFEPMIKDLYEYFKNNSYVACGTKTGDVGRSVMFQGVGPSSIDFGTLNSPLFSKSLPNGSAFALQAWSPFSCGSTASLSECACVSGNNPQSVAPMTNALDIAWANQQTGQLTLFKPTSTKNAQNAPFPQGVKAAGWIRDYIGFTPPPGQLPVGCTTLPFLDFSFALVVSKTASPPQQGYGSVFQGQQEPCNTNGPCYYSVGLVGFACLVDPLTENSPLGQGTDWENGQPYDSAGVPLPPLYIHLGADYYDAGTNSTNDFSKAVYAGPSPANLPYDITSYSGNNPGQLGLSSISFCSTADGDTPAPSVVPGDFRISANWYNVFNSNQRWTCVWNQYNLHPSSKDFWLIQNGQGPANSPLARIIGDAYTGFALGFIATTEKNPVVSISTLNGKAGVPMPAKSDSWPYNCVGYESAYFGWPQLLHAPFSGVYPPNCGINTSAWPAQDSPICNHNEVPYWQTPSGSWWGGNLFQANGPDGNPLGSWKPWTDTCWGRGVGEQYVYGKRYSDLFPPTTKSPSPNLNGLMSSWGQAFYPESGKAYLHPYEDRMQNGKPGCPIPGNQNCQLNVEFWYGMSAQSYSLSLGNGSSCVSDIAGAGGPDGVVDGADMAILLANYSGDEPCVECLGDVNGDTRVNGQDVAQVLADWGTCQ